MPTDEDMALADALEAVVSANERIVVFGNHFYGCASHLELMRKAAARLRANASPPTQNLARDLVAQAADLSGLSVDQFARARRGEWVPPPAPAITPMASDPDECMSGWEP